MTLVIQYRVQRDGKRIGRKRREYRLEGKVISAEKAQEMMKNPDVVIIDKRKAEVVEYKASDALTAIREVEKLLPEFVIDHSEEVEGGIFARNKDGDEMKLYDNRLEVVKASDGTKTIYTFDIAESRFIAELEKVGDAETFEITGDSGAVYKFGVNYELLEEETAPVEETRELLINYILNSRETARKARAA